MKPKIVYKCKTEGCTEYGKEIELRYYSFFDSSKKEAEEDYWMAKLKHCRKCYKTGEVVISYGDRNFSELDVFEEYIMGLAKEARLLRKLDERGVANDDERKQLKKYMDMFRDAKCPCCDKSLIEFVEND
jgi:hypothetical protein